MSNQMSAEQRRSTRKNAVQIPCISKTLFETPPQSKFFPIQMFYNLVHFTFSCLSKIVAGQFLITVFDYYVLKIEKTLDYCVPQENSPAGNGSLKSLNDSDRPMPWIFFIPVLILLRVLRFWFSVYSIIIGRGEVTAKQMQMKVVAFRRYYRSVRHYAVLDYSPIELLLKESRTSGSVRWQFVYSVYELIFMTKPPVEHHDNMPDGDEAEGSEEPDQSSRSTKGRKHVKSSLNEIDDYNDDDSSDGDLNTKELLDKYASIKDSSADPDFEPSSEELSSENNSEADTEEEKTESRKELNDKVNVNHTSIHENGYTSDIDQRDKSKDKKKTKDSSFKFNEQQLIDLESQLVTKIMKHFKDSYNYSPEVDKNKEEIFYSPIGSPPEKFYASDSDIPSSTLEPQNSHISSTETPFTNSHENNYEENQHS